MEIFSLNNASNKGYPEPSLTFTFFCDKVNFRWIINHTSITKLFLLSLSFIEISGYNYILHQSSFLCFRFPRGIESWSKSWIAICSRISVMANWQNIHRNTNKCPVAWQLYRFSDIFFDWSWKPSTKSCRLSKQKYLIREIFWMSWNIEQLLSCNVSFQYKPQFKFIRKDWKFNLLEQPLIALQYDFWPTNFKSQWNGKISKIKMWDYMCF